MLLTMKSLCKEWVKNIRKFGGAVMVLSECGSYNNSLLVQSSWNVMAHGDAREGKWRGNWRMEWVASALHSTSKHGVYPALLPLMRTLRLPAVEWTDAPADLNGLVRFAERRNLFSARVPSHFKRSLLQVINK